MKILEILNVSLVTIRKSAVDRTSAEQSPVGLLATRAAFQTRVYEEELTK
ncbi:MAG: hypothetical protein WB643_10115 [Candidatus Bathyarchaeia archaeon]